jgi:hypothetical protein
VLGFAVAIWQILKVRNAADAARDAALGLAERVRSRELLAKLGDAHNHLQAARDHIGRGDRQIAVIRLELSLGCAIDAREISQALDGRREDLDILIAVMSNATQQLTTMREPLTGSGDFIRLQLQLRQAWSVFSLFSLNRVTDTISARSEWLTLLISLPPS